MSISLSVRSPFSFLKKVSLLKNITREDAAKPETWATLMEELLFVLVCNDDPITARLYPFDASAFSGKRVFQIHMCHESQRWSPVTRPVPFGVQIWSLSSDRSLMVAGERCKIQPQTCAKYFLARGIGSRNSGVTHARARRGFDRSRKKLSGVSSRICRRVSKPTSVRASRDCSIAR